MKLFNPIVLGGKFRGGTQVFISEFKCPKFDGPGISPGYSLGKDSKPEFKR